MEMLYEILSWLFLMIGSLLIVVTGVAMIRLPDYFSRVHGASIGDTAGAAFVLVGLAFQADSLLIAVKLGMIVIFLVLTGPVSAYALAKAAWTRGLRPELADDAEDVDLPR